MRESIKILPLKDWRPALPSPLIIAGPCAAETRRQVLETASAISKIKDVRVLRAGVWKARTHPGAFAGAGDRALKWLREARERTGLTLAVEVARVEHVRACIKARVDMVWLGARTTVNPFLVDELARALKGANIPVLVKNPVSPDLPLWIGALERLSRAGIRRLAAVHRGFSAHGKTAYRNLPNWQIPVDLKIRFPALPVLCDPSHIAGSAALVGSVAQMAMDLDFDGLMVEAHRDPKAARSDTRQQLKPAALKRLLSSLVRREPAAERGRAYRRIERLRKKIDAIDARILKELSTRMDVVEAIGWLKKPDNISPLQARRWREMLRDRVRRGGRLGLRADFVRSILELLHSEALLRQMDIFKPRGRPKRRG